jgi:hypothetical protein
MLASGTSKFGTGLTSQQGRFRFSGCISDPPGQLGGHLRSGLETIGSCRHRRAVTPPRATLSRPQRPARCRRRPWHARLGQRRVLARRLGTHRRAGSGWTETVVPILCAPTRRPRANRKGSTRIESSTTCRSSGPMAAPSWFSHRWSSSTIWRPSPRRARSRVAACMWVGVRNEPQRCPRGTGSLGFAVLTPTHSHLPGKAEPTLIDPRQAVT